jgi:hypothetical protein
MHPFSLFVSQSKYGANINIPSTIATIPNRIDLFVNLFLHIIQKPERVK